MLALWLGRRSSGCSMACAGRHHVFPTALASSSVSVAGFASSAAVSKRGDMKFYKQPTGKARQDAIARAAEFRKGMNATAGEVAAAVATGGIEQAKIQANHTPPAGTNNPLKALDLMRPLRHPNPTTQSYSKQRTKLYDQINNAFVRAQLAECVRAMGLAVTATDKKAALVDRILLAWGWVDKTPDEYDTKVESEEHQMTLADLFLFQRNRDAHRHRGLSPRFDAHGSDQDGNPQAYTMMVTGTRAQLDVFKKWLNGVVKQHSQTTWTKADLLGWEPPKSTLWAVSNLTGAYIEVDAQNVYSATAAAKGDALRAREMVLEVAREATKDTNAVSASTNSGGVSLTPHLPAPSSPLPWKLAAKIGKRPFFRLAAVQSQYESVYQREAKQRVANIAVTPTINFAGYSKDAVLRDLAVATLQSLSNGADMTADDETSSLVLQLGHLLSPAMESNAALSLTAPVAGSDTLDSSRWNNLTPFVFCPTVPPVLVDSHLPSILQRTRRVTYHPQYGDGPVLTLEYQYPKAAERETLLNDISDEPAWVDRLGDLVAASAQEAEARDGEDLAPDEMHLAKDGLDALLGPDTTPLADPHPFETSLSASLERESATDVLLPERPVDTRIVARGSQAVPATDVPPLLTDFFKLVHTHAAAMRDTPLSDLVALRAVPPQATEPISMYDDDMLDPLDIAGEDGVFPSAARSHKPTTDHWNDPIEENLVPLLPPLHVTFRGAPYLLESDQVRDASAAPIREFATVAATLDTTDPADALDADADADDAHAHAHTHGSTNPPAGPGPYTAHQPPVGWLRTLAVVDLNGLGSVLRYAELEGKGDLRAMGDAVWRELAYVTSETVPRKTGRSGAGWTQGGWTP